jgi:hypothetical protein
VRFDSHRSSAVRQSPLDLAVNRRSRGRGEPRRSLIASLQSHQSDNPPIRQMLSACLGHEVAGVPGGADFVVCIVGPDGIDSPTVGNVLRVVTWWKISLVSLVCLVCPRRRSRGVRGVPGAVRMFRHAIKPTAMGCTNSTLRVRFPDATVVAVPCTSCATVNRQASVQAVRPPATYVDGARGSIPRLATASIRMHKHAKEHQ